MRGRLSKEKNQVAFLSALAFSLIAAALLGEFIRLWPPVYSLILELVVIGIVGYLFPYFFKDLGRSKAIAILVSVVSFSFLGDWILNTARGVPLPIWFYALGPLFPLSSAIGCLAGFRGRK